MSTVVTLNGSNYTIPALADPDWADNVSNYLIAIASGCLQKTGGTFTLTAEIDFGATYGLKSAYYKSRGTNPASAGQVRLANAETIKWRNAANSADLAIDVDSSNVFRFNGTKVMLSGAIVNADIDASAAIAYSKLAALTVSRALVSDGSGFVSVSDVTSTELGYVSGVTSAIQTQLNAKAPSASPTFTGTVTTPLTASRAVVTGSSSELSVSATTATELGYVSGVTSAIQTQLNAKANSSNPTLTTPTIDIITLDGQASTPSNPSSGFYKAYVKDTTQKLTILDSAGVETTVGSGAGSNNYITANDGTTIGDWITYDDGASSSPVDGTGGSPGATFVVSTSSAMRGTSNFLFTHDAADRQGEGFSYLMAIDQSDRGKVLRLTFDYLIASGVFADDGLAIWFYDATNSALIQPAPYLLKNSSLVERFSSEVQVPSSCASLRVIFHVTTATATAYTIRFDDFVFGQQAKLYGSPVIDWHDVTITGSWVTNATYTGKRRIVGDTEYYDVKVDTSGAPTATALSLTIPSTIDTSKLASTLTSAKILDASASVYDSSPDEKYQALVAYNTTTSVVIRSDDGDGTHSNVTSTNPITFASGDSVHVRFSIPVVGKSSSVVMSSDADTRVIALAVTGDPASATSGNPIIFPTVIYDTHGGYNATTGRYTVQSPGYYRFHGYTNGDAAAITIKIYKNAVAQVNLGITMPTYFATTMSGTVSCVAGDILDIRPDGTYNAASTSYLFIEKIQGPSQIAASDSMTARYTTASGQSIDNATDEIIDYGTKDFDSHGTVTTGASWKFTSQVSGEFEVTAAAAYTANATGVRQIALFKNNSAVSILDYQPGNGSVTGFVSGTDRIKLLAGDYIDIRAYQNSGGGLALISSSGALYNHIKISRVGNY